LAVFARTPARVVAIRGAHLLSFQGGGEALSPRHPAQAKTARSAAQPSTYPNRVNFQLRRGTAFLHYGYWTRMGRLLRVGAWGCFRVFGFLPFLRGAPRAESALDGKIF